MWVPLMEALAAAGRRCVAPDLYCLGDSDDPGPATFERNLERVQRLHRRARPRPRRARRPRLGRVHRPRLGVRAPGSGRRAGDQRHRLLRRRQVARDGRRRARRAGRGAGRRARPRRLRGPAPHSAAPSSPRPTSTPTGRRSPTGRGRGRRSSSTARWTSRSSRPCQGKLADARRPDPAPLGRRRPVRPARRRAPLRARDPRRAAGRDRGRRPLRLRPGAGADCAAVVDFLLDTEPAAP